MDLTNNATTADHRAMVVSADRGARSAVARALAGRGFAVTEAESAEAALGGLGRDERWVVVADQALPEMSGMSLLARLREAAPGCEVIVVGEHASVDAAMEASTLGASEYLAKPIEASLIADTAARVVARAQGNRRRRFRGGRDAAASVKMDDALTELLNPQEFEEIAIAELRRAERYGLPLSLVVISLDQMGAYRRIVGERPADEILRRTAALILGNTRGQDIVARHGLDGFAVLLPHADGEAACFVARKLRLLIVEIEVPGREQLPGEKFEVSAGISSYPLEADGWSDLQALARGLVRRSRAQGGGVMAGSAPLAN